MTNWCRATNATSRVYLGISGLSGKVEAGSSCKPGKNSIDCFNQGVVLQHFLRKGNAGPRKIAKVKLLRERSGKLMLCFCFSSWHVGLCLWIFGTRGYTCWWLYIIVTYRKFPGGHPNFPKEPRKIRRKIERCTGPSPPVTLQSHHAYGHIFMVKTSPSPLLSIPLFCFSSFPPPQMDRWGVWRDSGQTHCQHQT